MSARLVVEAGEASPLMYELALDHSISLGRNRHNNIILRDQHASRLHAEIFHQEGRWYLRDNATTNGTRLNGRRIRDRVSLENNAVITIGDIRLRFTVEVPGVTPLVPDKTPLLGEESEDTSTTLQADELSTLVRFLNDSLKETTPRGLLKLALGVLRRQTGADLCGCLSLDVDDPLPRVVVPDSGKVDAQLSRQLTRDVVNTSQAIWLAQSRSGAPDSDSLANFSDAICVPLLGSQGHSQRATPLGALHVYKFNRTFTLQQFRFCEALAASLANTLRSLRSRRALEADVSRLRYRAPNEGDELIGSSKLMKDLREEIDLLAEARCTVLVQGESGVGKELVALRLHIKSQRWEGPLVPVNCAAIVATMPEAELFGHEKGAFTGADRARPGHFQLADEGTLFLDEIGELSHECQAKLLRVLVEKPTFRPLGADYPITVDVRVVAATNRDLFKEVKEGRFREDLFYRLQVGQVQVPPLREHAEDIPELAEYFLKKLNEVNHKQVQLSETALQRMLVYTWPGNVRQLRSVLETAIVRARRDAVLEPTDLRLDVEVVASDRPPSMNLEEVQAWAIRQVLVQTNWNNSQAAPILGITRGTLIEKIKKYNLEP
jgi:Nif-specific regulatory protein